MHVVVAPQFLLRLPRIATHTEKSIKGIVRARPEEPHKQLALGVKLNNSYVSIDTHHTHAHNFQSEPRGLKSYDEMIIMRTYTHAIIYLISFFADTW